MNDLDRENKMIKGKYRGSCEDNDKEISAHAQMKVYYEELLLESKNEGEEKEKQMTRIEKDMEMQKEFYEDKLVQKDQQYAEQIKSLKLKVVAMEQDAENVAKFI